MHLHDLKNNIENAINFNLNREYEYMQQFYLLNVSLTSDNLIAAQIR
jgi:hypothetical protein